MGYSEGSGGISFKCQDPLRVWESKALPFGNLDTLGW